MRKSKQANKKLIIIISTVVAAVILGIALFFGGRAVYESGFTAGKQAMLDETSDKVKALGVAVSEKASFQDKVYKVFAELPSELNAEGIDKYLEGLKEITDSTKLEAAKVILEQYTEKWQSFKDVYASEDNGQITEKFNELKIAANDTASQLKTAYDEAIKQSVDNL